MAASVVLVYHKNAQSLYPKEWLSQFVHSINNQTNKNFDILEMNYGGDNFRLFPSSDFYQTKLDNFVQALNSLIILAKSKGYKYIFNTNCDDYFDINRIKAQVTVLDQGYDIVSSDFVLIDHSGNISQTHIFSKSDIKTELSQGNNVLCHPVIAYREDFFDSFSYVPSEIPREDLNLWQRSIHTKKFIIIPEVLCYHRIHSNSIGHQSLKGKLINT